ncbi:MAG: undecaprenyl-diphosphate phosphatase [Bacteroidetes bacterium]|nr:undecaprenyl-diphosphate phosphatase [Bacteroidota bacterium]
MNYLQAIILAIIEGITEFLPVSSTGHMIIGSSVMGIAQQEFTKTFTVAIQFGAILSVIVLYWKRFFQSADFYKKLIIAFIPAVLFGILFKKQINLMLGNVIVVACSLLIGGIIFLLLDKWFHRAEEKGSNELNSDASAFKIGLFQVIAMIPGVSRSAATIIGGLTQNLNKRAAAEFSFFLAVPTMFAATCKELYELYKEGGGISHDQVSLLLVGNVVAFVVALIAIRAFISYLVRHGFKVFGYYRIIIGLTILILHFVGIELNML